MKDHNKCEKNPQNDGAYAMGRIEKMDKEWNVSSDDPYVWVYPIYYCPYCGDKLDQNKKV